MHPTLVPTRATALAACFALLLCACSEHAEGQANHPRPARQPDATVTLVDRALAPWQVELLELAFRSASALPRNPHRKDRATAQDTVVTACLELDQPARALRYLEQIDGWQKGACYAELAWHCVQRDSKAPVEPLLEKALHHADHLGEDSGQEWRRDRIRAKVARTWILLGKAREAMALQTGLIDSELGETAAAKAKELDAADFDLQVKALDEVLASQNFDQIRGVMQMCARLHERFYTDAGRREQMAQRIMTGYPKLPVLARFEHLLDIAATAARNDDRLETTALVEFGRSLLDRVNLLPEDRLPLLARLAELRGRAGDLEGARKEAEATLALFQQKRTVIDDVFRGRALRLLAEALHSFGCDERARQVYLIVVQEGVHNPNSRPRAEDLTATCLSMAVTGCEPDAGLRQRMTEICAALGHPW